MKNGLYIVSTPIGNLGDISSRAIKTLGESDIIICENPKHSLKLLSKLDIKKKLISLHDYNEENIIDKIRDHLDNNKLCETLQGVPYFTVVWIKSQPRCIVLWRREV